MQRQHNFLFACNRQKFAYNSIGEIAYQIDGSFRHNSIEGGIVCLIRLKTIVPPKDVFCPSGASEAPPGPVYQASSHYIHRKVADMDVLISVGGNIANFNEYIELNPSASLLWEALAQPKTAAELAAALQSAYGIAPEQARADVQEFLELLVQDRKSVV